MTTVEERARQAALEYAAKQVPPRSRTMATHDYREGYLAGHAASASEDRAALERANGLLREAHKVLNGEQDCCLKAMEAHGYAHDDDCLAARIKAHLSGQETAPT
jgi:hypothetical protein